MLRKLLYVVLVGALPFLNSCKGPEGAVGPSGAAGPAGVAGAPGAKGEPGDGGGSVAVQFSRDTLSTNAQGQFGFGFTLENAAVAKTVERGAVLMYVKSENLWFPLPGVVFFKDDASSYTFAYGLDGLEMNIVGFESVEKPKVRKFQSARVVIIPAVDGNGRLNAAIDYKDYQAVRKAYNLPE